MRTPYFLYAAIAVPFVDAIALFTTWLFDGFARWNTGGNAGGYAIGVLGTIVLLAGISTIAGLVFSIVSIYRKERGRTLAAVCVALYIVPCVWTTGKIALREISKWRGERFEAAQRQLHSN